MRTIFGLDKSTACFIFLTIVLVMPFMRAESAKLKSIKKGTVFFN